MAGIADYDVPEDVKRLKSLLEETLEALVEVYEANNVPLPARRYWSMGTPALDCEQAVVSFVNLYLGRPGDQAQSPLSADTVKSAVISIAIGRPAATPSNKTGAPPTPESIQTLSELPAVDAWLLADNLKQFDAWSKTGYGPSAGVIATVNTTEPQGGFQQTIMQLTVAVP